jgi:glycosyltransferase involved in cell wall biosynthesis
MDARTGKVSTPRLGVLDFHPIQYHTPLYQLLAARGNVELDVLYLNDLGLRSAVDPGFGVPFSWDIDLLSGYRHQFLAGSKAARAIRLSGWLRRQEIVVIHGHSNPWMLAAAALCRASGLPYLLRGDASPRGLSVGLRAVARHAVASGVVSGSAGGLAVGERNMQFYARYRAPRIVFAPHSVDNERFGARPPVRRADLLGRWALDPARPVIMFCGKLIAVKRPLDLAAAVTRLSEPVSTLFVGDGELAEAVRAALPLGTGAITGFVNQRELPAYYHAADILVLPSQSEPWGLVVNEAMTAGMLPVVSDRVGCGPDLVSGLGEIYPWGDISALTAALRRALSRVGGEGLADRLRQRVAGYGIEVTALGFERAAHDVLVPESSGMIRVD